MCSTVDPLVVGVVVVVVIVEGWPLQRHRHNCYCSKLNFHPTVPPYPTPPSPPLSYLTLLDLPYPIYIYPTLPCPTLPLTPPLRRRARARLGRSTPPATSDPWSAMSTARSCTAESSATPETSPTPPVRMRRGRRRRFRCLRRCHGLY